MAFTRIADEVNQVGPAFRRYAAVILALLHQEFHERRRSFLGSIAELLEPLFIMVAITMVFTYIGRAQVPPLGTSPMLFFATGVYPHFLFLYTSSAARRQTSIRSRFPVEQQLDHVFARTVLRVVDYTILGILLFSGIALFATPAAIPHPLGPLLLAAVTIVMLGFAWGILDLVIGRKFKIWMSISPIIGRGMMLVSGEFFVVDFLPPNVRYVLSFNPLLHAVMLFRLSFYSYKPFTLDVPYLLACSLFGVTLGIAMERLMRRRMEQ
jgi:capsular polysaccharide transport system permease protein